MKDKKNIAPVILVIATIVSLFIYFILTFLPIFKFGDAKLTIYKAAFGYEGIQSSSILLLGVIFSFVSLAILLVSHILYLFKVKNYIHIMLDAISLPLLAISLGINIFSYPIFKYTNNDIASQINALHYVLIPQCILLMIAILLNIVLIFYLSIKGYKTYKFKRRKEIY